MVGMARWTRLVQVNVTCQQVVVQSCAKDEAEILQCIWSLHLLHLNTTSQVKLQACINCAGITARESKRNSSPTSAASSATTLSPSSVSTAISSHPPHPHPKLHPLRRPWTRTVCRLQEGKAHLPKVPCLHKQTGTSRLREGTSPHHLREDL